MLRRRLGMAGILVLFAVLVSQSFLDSIRLNQLSMATARWFHAGDVSVMDLGLRLEYGQLPQPGHLASYPEEADCQLSPRLSLRTGIIQLLNNNYDGAAKCLTAALTSAPDALDTLILATSAYHLTGQASASRATFERLPEGAQGLASIEAMVMFDYLPVTPQALQEAPPADQLGGIVARQTLFDLLSQSAEIARVFLEKATKAGIFSASDWRDVESFESWKARRSQDGMVNQPPMRTSIADESRVQAVKRSLAESLGCAEDGVKLGPNLLPEGLFFQSRDLGAWQILPWATGSASFSRGEIVFGFDIPDSASGVNALRISGLWKEDDTDRYPASGNLELVKPITLPPGRRLYLMLARYKTENVRSGQTSLWLDSADYRRFVGVWQLPSTDGVWQAQYALGYVDGDVRPFAHPMISHSALGTTYVDSLQIMPVSLSTCDLGARAMVFGAVVADR